MIEALRSDIPQCPIDPSDPALARYLIASMGSLPDERLRILFLDAARRLIADEQLQHGTLAHLAIYPRTIFRRALEHNAAAIILVHNHPSGDPLPSDEDIAVTRKLDQLGLALDVRILDHIVVTATQTRHVQYDENDPPARATSYMLKSRSDSENRETRALAVQNVQTTVRRRQLRRQLLGHADLFGEPAWDMLLDLFIHECEGRLLSMSSLCVAAGIPTSSAMRLVLRMCDAGLIERIPDVFDRRRSLMRIAPDVAHRMQAYFAEGSE